MNNDPIYVTFEFNGNLGEEVNRVKLGIAGLGDESSKTYQRLLSDSNEAFNAMNANNRRLAVSIQEDIRSLRQLSAASEALDQSYQSGRVSADEYVQAKARLTKQEDDLREGIRAQTDTLNESIRTEQQAVDSIRARQEALAQLETKYRNLSAAERNGAEGQKMAGDIRALKTELNDLDNAYRQTTGSSAGLLTNIQAMPGPLGSAAMAMGRLTKAALAFIATPVGVVLAAIAAALATVTSWFRRTEEGQDALRVGAAAFGQVLNSILDVIDNVGKWLYKAFTEPKAALNDMTDFIKNQFTNRLSALADMGAAIAQIFSKDWKEGFAAFGDAFLKFGTGVDQVREKVGAFVEDTVEKTKRSMAIQDELNNLYKEEQALTTERSEKAAQLIRLREMAMDQQASSQERQKAINEIEKINLDLLTRQKAIDERRYQLQVEKNKLSHSNREDVEAEHEALRKMHNTEAELAQESLSLIRLKNGVNRQQNKETSETAIDQVKKELETRKQAYERYYQYVENLGRESANRTYADLVKEGESYREYLNNQIGKLRSTENRTREQDDVLSYFYVELSQLDGKKSAADLLQEEIDKLKKLYGDDLVKLRDALTKLQEANTGDMSESGVQKNNVINKALADADAEADEQFKTLLKTYQSGFQRLAALEEQYNRDVAMLRSRINDETTEQERAQIESAVQARTQAYGNAMLKESELFQKLFGNLTRESTKALERMLEEAKTLDTTGFSAQDVKVFEDAVLKLEAELRQRNPFKSLADDFDNLVKEIKSGNDLTNALANFNESFEAAKDYVLEMGDSLGQVFGEDVGYAIQQAAELTQAIADVGTGIAQLSSGNILGGLQSVIKGIGSIFSIGKRVKEQNRKAREEMQSYYTEAIAGEMEYQRLLRERLRTTQQIGETTLEYNKRITAELAQQQKASLDEYNRLFAQIQGEEYISGVGYRHGTWFRKAKTWNEYASLSGKTYEDIEKLYTEGKLEDKVSSLFEQLRALKEEGVDINTMLAEQEEAMRQAWTGTTSDSIADSIIKGFAEGKKSAADFASDFEEMLNNAVLQGIKMQALEEPLRQWYEQFAEASGSSLTAAKIADLRAQYDKIIADAAQQLEDMEKVTGMSVAGTASRTAAASGIASMSQDSANELNGNFNALLIFADTQAKGITNINTLLVQGLEVWHRIAANTDRLESIENDIRIMRTSLQDVVNKGLILRK